MAPDLESRPTWSWPPDRAAYEGAPDLSHVELGALHALGDDLRWWRSYASAAPRRRRESRPEWASIRRLLDPLAEARRTLWAPGERARRNANKAVAYILLRCAEEGRSYWGWDEAAWVRVCGRSQRSFFDVVPVWGVENRQYVIALAYLFGTFNLPLPIGDFQRTSVACKIFGPHVVRDIDERLLDLVQTLGYRSADRFSFRSATWEALLLTRRAELTSLTASQASRAGARSA